jgi:hypothetical protein
VYFLRLLPLAREEIFHVLFLPTIVYSCFLFFLSNNLSEGIGKSEGSGAFNDLLSNLSQLKFLRVFSIHSGVGRSRKGEPYSIRNLLAGYR